MVEFLTKHFQYPQYISGKAFSRAGADDPFPGLSKEGTAAGPATTDNAFGAGLNQVSIESFSDVWDF